MSSLLRLLLYGSLALVVAYLVISPRQWRRFGRRARMVGYAYVVAVLLSALLRLLLWQG